MNKHIQEAVFRQQVRRKIRKIVREHKKDATLNEQDLYSTFVEPFKDAISAANLALQDVVSSLTMWYSLFFTINPEKMNERIAKFDERYKKIGEKWAPIMERTDASLSTGDADVVAWAFAPGLYGASVAVEQGMKAGETVNDFVTGSGIKSAILGVLPGVIQRCSREWTKNRLKIKVAPCWISWKCSLWVQLQSVLLKSKRKNRTSQFSVINFF